MSMTQSRRKANGQDDSYYYTADAKKYFIDDRPRPMPDLNLSSITEVRHKQWVFHRPPPKSFRRLALHPVSFLIGVLGIAALVYFIVNL